MPLPMLKRDCASLPKDGHPMEASPRPPFLRTTTNQAPFLQAGPAAWETQAIACSLPRGLPWWKPLSCSDRPCSIYNILEVSIHGDTVLQTEDKVAIKEYIVRKTLDLLFFFPFIFFKKNKTKQKKAWSKIFLRVVTDIIGLKVGALKQKKAPVRCLSNFLLSHHWIQTANKAQVTFFSALFPCKKKGETDFKNFERILCVCKSQCYKSKQSLCFFFQKF